MVVTRLNKKEWSYLVERGLRKHKLAQLYQEENFWRLINEHRVIPMLIGAGACIAVVSIWDWHELLNILLSWVIGIVVVTTLVAGILHPGYQAKKRQ